MVLIPELEQKIKEHRLGARMDLAFMTGYALSALLNRWRLRRTERKLQAAVAVATAEALIGAYEQPEGDPEAEEVDA